MQSCEYFVFGWLIGMFGLSVWAAGFQFSKFEPLGAPRLLFPGLILGKMHQRLSSFSDRQVWVRRMLDPKRMTNRLIAWLAGAGSNILLTEPQKLSRICWVQGAVCAPLAVLALNVLGYFFELQCG